MIAHVDAAHWWGPLGWLYRNTTGNIAASALWGPIGLVIGATWAKRKVIHPIHRRLDEQDASVGDLHAKHDRLHEHLVGKWDCCAGGGGTAGATTTTLPGVGARCAAASSSSTAACG